MKKSRKNNKKRVKKSRRKYRKSRKIKGGSPFIIDKTTQIKWCSLDNAYIRFKHIRNPFLKNEEIPHRFFSDKFKNITNQTITTTIGELLFRYTEYNKIFENAYEGLKRENLIKEEGVIGINIKIIIVIVFLIGYIIQFPFAILKDSLNKYGLNTEIIKNISNITCKVFDSEYCKLKHDMDMFLSSNNLNNIFINTYTETYDNHYGIQPYNKIFYEFLREVISSKSTEYINSLAYIMKYGDIIKTIQTYIDLEKLRNNSGYKTIEGEVSINPDLINESNIIEPPTYNTCPN